MLGETKPCVRGRKVCKTKKRFHSSYKGKLKFDFVEG
jgi:hypothetical protein